MRKLTTGLICGLSSLLGGASAEQIYLLANQPTAASYSPADVQVGRTGAASPAVTISRSGTGAYSVNFGGAMLMSPEGNIQVSAADADGRYCKIRSWGSGVAVVRCFAANGAPVDARFSLLATRASSGASGVAYAWVAGGASPRVSAQYAYAQGGTASAERTGPGQYRVFLPGALSGGGNVQSTAYGDGSEYCNVASWTTNSVQVRCYNAAGSPADSAFTVLATDQRYAPPGGRVAYLWADNQTAAQYQPNATYAKTEADGLVIRRRSAGWYQVQIGGIVTGGGGVQVTAYASTARCEPAGWAGGGIVVRCHAPGGAPADSRFSLLVVRSGPTTIIAPDLPIVVDAPTIVATPTLRHRINVVEHLCINTTCEYGDRGWDKTNSEKSYDGTSETTFEVDVDNARLVRLCPVRRRTTDREFGGNGPAVRAHSEVTKSGETLRLTAFMEAEETGSGSSIAFKTWNGDLYKAPAGWRISGFEPTRSETSYTDSNHEEDVPPVRGGSLVSEFRFKGDTGGDDIGNCTTDDTYMTITYNPMVVTLNAQRNDLRAIRVDSGLWTGLFGLGGQVTRLAITINNYDRTKSQPETEEAEDKYYIDRTDREAWDDLTDAQIRQASFYEFRAVRGDPTSVSVPATPLPVPKIRRNTFTFLLNSIVANGRGNSVAPAGDHIRLTIPFESNEAEVVAACVDNIICGTGEPHEAGKPIVQVNNMRVIPYLRPRVERVGGDVRIRAELSRIRLEADIFRDGTCRDNLFAFACGAFAGNIERIAYEAVLDQLNAFVAGSADLLGLLDDQLTTGFCQLLAAQGEDCDRLENIVLDENGDLLLWVRE